MLFRSAAPLALTLLFAPSIAGAGWYARQVDKSAKESPGAEMYYQDGKLRVDQGKDTSVIFDMRSGAMTMLNHADKSYLTQTLEEMGAKKAAMVKQMKEQMSKLPPETKKQLEPKIKELEGGSAEFKPVATGKKDKVGAYDCEIWTWKSDSSEGEFCLTKQLDGQIKDFVKDTEQLQKKMAALKLGGAQAGGMAMLELTKAGFPVRTKTKMSFGGQSMESTSEVAEFKTMGVPGDKFAVPAAYTKKQAPEMPAGPGGPAPK